MTLVLGHHAIPPAWRIQMSQALPTSKLNAAHETRRFLAWKAEMAAPEALPTGKSVPYGKHGLSRIRELGGGAQAPCSELSGAAPIRAKLDSIEEPRLDCRQRRRSA